MVCILASKSATGVEIKTLWLCGSLLAALLSFTEELFKQVPFFEIF